MSSTWSQMYISGSAVELVPGGSPNGYHLADIAYGLARQNRFNGQSRLPWSVAQHSLLMANMAPTPSLRLEALLHDAVETYLGDLSAPVKSLCPDFQKLEKALDSKLREAYAIPLEMSEEIKRLDMNACLFERNSLLKTPPKPWVGLEYSWSSLETKAARLLMQEYLKKSQEEISDLFFTSVESLLRQREDSSATAHLTTMRIVDSAELSCLAG